MHERGWPDMKLRYTISFFLLWCASANAQQPYDVSLIPKDLLSYASSVIRDQEVTAEIKDLNNIVFHTKQAVTILNKNGDDMANINLWYDGNDVIRSVKGTIYNSAGIEVRKFSESDFEDVNTTDGFSLFEDIKVKYFKPAVTDYPYTIEYEYDEKDKQTLYIEGWEPNSGFGVAVQNSSYTITCKKGFNIRYKEINLPSAVDISTGTNGSTIYSWSIKNLKAVRDEPFSPNPEKYLSTVDIAPREFIYDGFNGSFTNWNQFGKWIYDNLLVNRQKLPDATIKYIQDLTSGITDPKLKAKKIYEYMQGKTHYVSVQIGIGGLQPFLASDVDRLNYGDCKALVNYTRALLMAVGIDSWYCVVTGDHERKISMLSDFASLQGNHAILCIPFKNDTTWCDCTSETIPFGYLGDFTDDRTALAITPTGGKLMHTPKYTAPDNLTQRKADFLLSENGTISGQMITNFKGVDYDDRYEMSYESHTEQVKDIQRIYPINNLEVQKLNYVQNKSLDPVTTENIVLNAPEYASVDNGRIIFYPNAANRLHHAPKDVMNRKEDVYINEGYTEIDDISYILPSGYRMDSQPLNVSVKNQFGTFTSSSVVKDGKLIYKRKLQVLDGTYSKDTYPDLVDFFQQVVDADDHSVTLIKTAN